MWDAVARYVASLVSPREAEATIVGAPDMLQLVEQVYGANAPQPGYIPQFYARTIRQAQRVPEEVELLGAPGMSSATYGDAGLYQAGKIYLDPQMARQDIGHPLVHELLHFLSDRRGQQVPLNVQHELIKSLLGSPGHLTAAQVRGYQPPPLTPEQMRLLQQWFQD
jgi:hypothetical protein